MSGGSGRAARREVGIIAERQPVDSPWADHRWRVTEVLPGPAQVEPWTVLADAAEGRRYFAGNAELLLFPLETESLKANIEGPAPAVYVFLRQAAAAPGMVLLGATVDAGEAGAHVDTGSDVVEAVAMPDGIAAWVAAFVAENHVERQSFKRRRERWGREDGA
jgi:hypothetical protein